MANHGFWPQSDHCYSDVSEFGRSKPCRASRSLGPIRIPGTSGHEEHFADTAIATLNTVGDNERAVFSVVPVDACRNRLANGRPERTVPFVKLFLQAIRSMFLVPQER